VRLRREFDASADERALGGDGDAGTDRRGHFAPHADATDVRGEVDGIERYL
jgi:hypothetical protein